MPTSEAHEFVRTTLDAFRLAHDRASSTSERTYSVGGTSVLVRYAGAALPDAFDRALAPLRTDPVADPALTISCWDQVSSDQPLPAAPFAKEDVLARGRIRGFDGDGVRATYDALHRLLNLYDPDARDAVFVAKDVAQIPPWITRAPFRAIFGWNAIDRGLAVVHTSAVGGSGGCALVTGASGSGKSTTAFACVERGLRIIADDVALVALGPEPRAFACAGVGKIEDDSLVTIDDLGLPVVERRNGQTMLDLSSVLTPSAPVRVIVAARVGGGERCQVTRLSSAASFRALAGHSVVEALTGDARALTALRELATRVPAVRVDVGTDLDDVAATIRGLLERGGAA